MRIEIKQNILADNKAAAEANRLRLAGTNVFMINMMASPGAGKTSSLIKALEGLKHLFRMAVIEGDIASEIDALKVESLGVSAVQINTGGGCHLTAPMIGAALDHLDLAALDIVFVENVGNLVCPAEFDLGEGSRVVVASVAEGHDKPHKYPLVFQNVEAVLLNKMDLIELCDFDLDDFLQTVAALNAKAAVIEMSCRDGSGTGEWLNWIVKTVGGGGQATTGER